MKKILLGLMVLSLASLAFADGVKIDWQINYGAYTHNAPNVVDDPSSYTLLDHYSVTWQLIYAGANGVAEAPNPANVAGGFVGTGVGADDVVWATRLIAQGGGTASDGTAWDHWMLWDGLTGDTVYKDYTWGATAGSVYQRIFEGAPATLSWYFDGAPMAFATGFNASNEQLAPDYLRDGSLTLGGVQPGNQIGGVPEPVTMSLMGLGALVLAIRRRRS